MIHLLQINVASGEPIYQQLTEQILRLIAGGELQAGEELPSVRQVASALSINPMTVSRSYQMLLAQGAVFRPRGQKMRVAQLAETSIEDKLAMLHPTAKALVKQGKELRLELPTLQRMLEQCWQQDKTDEK